MIAARAGTTLVVVVGFVVAIGAVWLHLAAHISVVAQ